MRSQMRLLYPNNFEPFTYTECGLPKGILIDRLIQVLSTVEDPIEPEFISTRHDSIITDLEKGRGDVVIGLAVNDERSKTLVFSGGIVLTGGALFCPTGANPFISPGVLVGKVIATPTSGPLIGLIKEKFSEVQVLQVDDYRAALEAVLIGKAAAAALNFHAGIEISKNAFPGRFDQPQEMFVSLTLAAAGLKNHSEPFIDKINQGLA